MPRDVVDKTISPMVGNMSLTPQTLRRLSQIKKGLLLNHNRETIGKSCGVTEKTIDRDIKAWTESGDFETWVKEEWLRLHPQIVEKYPTLAYKELSRIVGKMVTKRLEAHTIEEIREIKLMWIKDESNPTNKVQAT